MDKLFRFSDYDIFGYLASGLVMLATWDKFFGSHIVLDPNWTVSSVVFAVICAYVVGHIVSELAIILLDRWFIRGIIGKPSDTVMRKLDPKWRVRWYHYLLGEYFVPLHSDVRARVITRAELSSEEADKNTGLGESIFWRALPFVKREPIPYARLDVFLKLYGFCRNITLVALIAAGLFSYDAAIRNCQGDLFAEQRAWWAVLALAASFFMFSRYLKFMRLYVVEVFVTFAETSKSSSE